MSEVIPEDVTKRAISLWMDLSNQRADGQWVDPVKAIARAFLAERERCAAIAEGNNAWPSEGADIAAAIRQD